MRLRLECARPQPGPDKASIPGVDAKLESAVLGCPPHSVLRPEGLR